jgi:hypothetical protein
MKNITTIKNNEAMANTANNYPSVPETGGGFEKKRCFSDTAASFRICLIIAKKGRFCLAITGRVRGFNLYTFQSGFI